MTDGTEFASAIAQFGVAGLMGWMWLSERRAAGTREAQLTQAHERLVQERAQADALLTVIRDNTRALALLEAGQRTLVALLESLAHAGRRPDPPASSPVV
jgi:hypothetical protein